MYIWKLVFIFRCYRSLCATAYKLSKFLLADTELLDVESVVSVYTSLSLKNQKW